MRKISILLFFVTFLVSCGEAQQTPTLKTTFVPILKPIPVATLKPTPRGRTMKQTDYYPPITLKDVQVLASRGNAHAVHELSRDSVGLVGICPQPKREVTVDIEMTGRQLAENLLAYFYANHLESPCGSLVIAYHDQSESGEAYTAGRVDLTVIDSHGFANIDPHSIHNTYRLTLNLGAMLLDHEEYVITYTKEE